MLRGQADGPGRQEPGKLARLFVIAGPLDGLLRLVELRHVLLVGVPLAPRLERVQRALGPLAAVDARRPEEDHRVLNLLLLEPSERLEIFRQDAYRARLVA